MILLVLTCSQGYDHWYTNCYCCCHLFHPHERQSIQSINTCSGWDDNKYKLDPIMIQIRRLVIFDVLMSKRVSKYPNSSKFKKMVYSQCVIFRCVEFRGSNVRVIEGFCCKYCSGIGNESFWIFAIGSVRG